MKIKTEKQRKAKAETKIEKKGENETGKRMAVIQNITYGLASCMARNGVSNIRVGKNMRPRREYEGIY